MVVFYTAYAVSLAAGVLQIYPAVVSGIAEWPKQKLISFSETPVAFMVALAIYSFAPLAVSFFTFWKAETIRLRP
ncbi:MULTISPECIES: hypothetical protein [unclassified Aureimonas]|uniref:hypothetical protein n=1 Tax=unclassified Aureimonas TaxID=2615206 RepID=UPI00070FD1F0|nr:MULTISPECIES: hypothetical protein [unclassified Aureimonas]KQT62229.1 hypothetical protein ASG62_23110 [Aureimonas sp. Leaf427]KQT72534.1 hypothetical protein ASG54_18455 [Aureimonas sp. Leaf460]